MVTPTGFFIKMVSTQTLCCFYCSPLNFLTYASSKIIQKSFKISSTFLNDRHASESQIPELFAKNAFFGHFGDFQAGYGPN